MKTHSQSLAEQREKEGIKAIVLEERACVKATDHSLQGKVRCSEWQELGKYSVHEREEWQENKPLGAE